MKRKATLIFGLSLSACTSPAEPAPHVAVDPTSPPPAAPAPAAPPPAAPAPAAPRSLAALAEELDAESPASALARLDHYRALCDADGYPLVGNVVRKGPRALAPSALCAKIRVSRR